jgi:hypothetical protein
MLPDYMHKFREDARRSSRDPNQPPNVLRADKLDTNFKACLPVEETGSNAPYKVLADEHGWRLEPALLFDVCENGKLMRYRFMAQRVFAEG